MRKILIIQTAFIGDVILATPLIEHLKNRYPQASIDFLLRKGNEGLLEGHPHINELLIWDKKKQKTLNLFRIIKEIRKRKYDLTINIQRFLSTGLITALSNSKTTSGFKKNPMSIFFKHRINHQIGDSHETERNLSLIGSTGDIRPRLYPLDKNFQNTQALKSSKYICIAPSSVWFTKQFAAHKWEEFIKQIPADFTTYLIGGKTDSDYCDAIIKKSGNKAINLCGKLNFLDTAALMKDAAMNYVNDSAPMHIASSMNAPITAIFCSTVPEFGFGPLSNNSAIIECEESLSCRPCGLHGHKKCPEGHFNCSEKISINKLLDRLTSL